MVLFLIPTGGSEISLFEETLDGFFNPDAYTTCSSLHKDGMNNISSQPPDGSTLSAVHCIHGTTSNVSPTTYDPFTNNNPLDTSTSQPTMTDPTTSSLPVKIDYNLYISILSRLQNISK